MHGPRILLRSSEWLLTGSLLIFLFTMIVISKIKASQTGSERKREIVFVDVSIDGHVRKPGIYSIAMGTPVQVILNKAFPKKNADLQSLSLKKIISQPCSIYVECLKELSICIEGEVLNPGLFRVPFGSRISDLKHLVSVSQNADLKYFKKRRLLQDGETINIPPSQSLQKN